MKKSRQELINEELDKIIAGEPLLPFWEDLFVGKEDK